MANMSYCRFRNTRLDLNDCLQTLRDGDFDGENGLREEEHIACVEMFQEFISFCYEEGIIEDEDGELDDRLEEFLSRIPHEK